MDDITFKYIHQLAINLKTAGQTWADLDSVNTDSLKHMAQINHRPGYMAGNVLHILNKGEINWPIPVLSVIRHHAHGHGDGRYTENTGVSGNNGGEVLVDIYPNPTTGTVTIQASEAGIFVLYSLDGREIGRYAVQDQATTVIFPSGLTAGIYMGRFMAGSGSVTNVKIVYQPN